MPLTQRKGAIVEDAGDAVQPPDLGALLVSFRRSVQTTARARIEPFGVSMEEFAMLNALRAGGPNSVTRLAHALNYEPGRVGRDAHRLTQEGLLRSRRPRSDRRIIELRLTPRGEEIAAEIGGLLDDAYAELLRGSSAEDVELLVEMMGRVRANYQRMRDAEAASDPDQPTDS